MLPIEDSYVNKINNFSLL